MDTKQLKELDADIEVLGEELRVIKLKRDNWFRLTPQLEMPNFIIRKEESLTRTIAILRRLRDRDGVEELCYDSDMLCSDCEGRGFIGIDSLSGKKISCESCGGHEDALGKGFQYADLATSLQNWLVGGKA